MKLYPAIETPKTGRFVRPTCSNIVFGRAECDLGHTLVEQVVSQGGGDGATQTPTACARGRQKIADIRYTFRGGHPTPPQATSSPCSTMPRKRRSSIQGEKMVCG